MPMKLKGVLTFAAAAMAAGAASAADIYQPPPPVTTPIYTPTPAYNWTGFYLGVSGGYGWGKAVQENTDLLIGDISTKGWFAGGQVGANWQSPGSPLVFGVEADAFWSGIEGSVSETLPYYGDTTVNHKLDWFGTARARIGFAMDNVMPYVTGGFAFGQGTRSTVWDGSGGGDLSAKASHHGWAAGAGVEWAFAQNWTAKAEYLYTDLGTEEYALGLPVGPGDPEVDLKFHTVKVGLNYKF